MGRPLRHAPLHLRRQRLPDFGAQRIGLIAFEYGGTYIDSRSLLRDIWELVGAANPSYRFYKLHHDGPRPVPEYRQTLETYQYSNWVVMAPDHPAARD